MKGESTNRERKMLMVEKWPEINKKLVDAQAEKEFCQLQEIVTKIRNLRSSYRIKPADHISASVNILDNQEIISRLARVKFSDVKKGIAVSAGNIKLILDISSLIDVDKEKKRLETEIVTLERLIAKNEAMLKNKDFIKNAPKEVIEKNKTNLFEYKNKIKETRELFNNLTI
jgi:valyl-tRNA synthetase